MYEPKAPRKTAEYDQARTLIKSTEPAEEKIKELLTFLDEIQGRIDEIIQTKRELEEVRLLTETYIENLFRRIAQENEREFERLLKEFAPRLPKKILEDIESF
jgi:ArsR family transcriptional regulator